jgi:hypothetical protein
MIYSFQSRNKNTDVGDVIRFRNFMFHTSDEEIAEMARRNCSANPSEYWEITGGTAPPPAVKTVTGIRTSEVRDIQAGASQEAPPVIHKKPGRPKKAQPNEGVTT